MISNKIQIHLDFQLGTRATYGNTSMSYNKIQIHLDFQLRNADNIKKYINEF